MGFMGITGNLFGMLKGGMHDASKMHPSVSMPCMGFTKQQMAKADMQHPHLLWYDVDKDEFYDQGFFTAKSSASALKGLDALHHKTAITVKNLKYYIPITDSVTGAADALQSEYSRK